jgi:hypothetical protein
MGAAPVMSNTRKAKGPAHVTYQSPGRQTMDSKMDLADVPGGHLWVMMGVWGISDPAKAHAASMTKKFDHSNAVLLDQENLLSLAGPMCFKCESPYSTRLARVPCIGSVSE